MVKVFLMALGMVCLVGGVNAQQVDEASLERKYWNYRERQRLKFIKLNADNGGGLSFAKRNRKVKCGQLQGALEGGDLGMTMGYYLGMLAMEYANFERAGRDLTPTLNEIYYAINAIRRVDEKAEPFFDPSLDESMNGFFVRNDFRQDFYKDWEAQGDAIHLILGGSSMGAVPKPGATLNTINKIEDGLLYHWYEYISDFEDKKYVFPSQTYLNGNTDSNWIMSKCRYTDMGVDPINGTPTTLEQKKLLTNEMSQDQLIGYLFGLAYIKEFVPNVYVKPTAQDRGFKIHDEIKTITTAWMDFISSERTFGGTEEDKIPLNPSGSCALNYEAKSNWIISNPVEERMVTRGSELFVFAYPIERTAKRLYGSGWESLANYNQYTTGHEIEITDFYNENSAGIGCASQVALAKMQLQWQGSVDWDDWKTVWEGPIQNDFDNLSFKLKWNGTGLMDVFLGRVKLYLVGDNAQEYLVGEVSGNGMAMRVLSALTLTGNLDASIQTYDLGEMDDYTVCLLCKAGILDEMKSPCTPFLGSSCNLPSTPIVENTFFSNDNVEMSVKLAIASNTWSHDNIVHWAETKENHWYFDIADAVLNDRNCTYSKADYEALLNKAPETYISGITDEDWDADDADTDWKRQNMFRISTTNNHDNDANYMDYSGLDYLFLYNLYKYKFWEDTDKSYDPSNACLCYNTALYTPKPYVDDQYRDEHLASSYHITDDQSTPDRFPNYRNLGYHTADWIHNKVDLYNGGTLTVNGDLNVCSKDAGVNSAEIKVNQGSHIELTASPSTGLGKELRIRKNSRLYLQGGKLIVGDNSKVVIEKNGTFRVKDQSTGAPAEIVLNGDNAVLQIEGTLDIADYSTFKISGTGKIIFYSYNPDCIQFGRESQFIINGNGSDDVVMEVMTEKLRFKGSSGHPIKNVKISNGKILLANQTMLEVDAPFELNGVAITKRHTNDFPYGLRLLGERNTTIKHCSFSHMKFGVEAGMFLTGMHLKVEHSDFHDLSYGIVVSGGGLSTKMCDIRDNTVGVITVFATLPTTIAACHIENNTRGVFHLMDNLYFKFPYLDYNNDYAVSFDGRSLSAFCGNITNSIYGIKGEGTELILSHKYKKETGYVDFSGNTDGIVFNGLDMRIDNGYNDFRAFNVFTTNNLGIDLFVRPSFANSNASYRQFRVNKNVWGTGIQNLPVDQNSGSGIGNYSVLYDNSPGAPISMPFATPVTTIPFIPSCPSTTTTSGRWKPGIPNDGGTGHNPENGTPTLSDPDPDGEFDSVNVDTAIVTVLEGMYNDTIPLIYSESTERLGKILLIAENESWEFGPDVYLDYLYNYAYLRMMEAFGMAMVEENVREDNPALGQLVMQVQNHLIDEIEESENAEYVNEERRYHLYFDLATTQWALQDHAAAATTLTQMLTWVSGDQLAKTQRALCRVNFEKDVIDGVIPYTPMDDPAYPCTDNWATFDFNSNSTGTTGTGLEDVDQNTVKVPGAFALYPNPAHEKVFVQTPLFKEPQKLRITFYDMQGKAVMTTTEAQMMGRGMYELDISSVADGLYLVECRLGDEVSQIKLSVLHE